MSDPAGETVGVGVPSLEAILGGPLPRRGIVFVVGVPGAGKTLLVQQLAFAAARAGRPSLYFSGLAESNEQLVDHLRPFAFFDAGMLGEGVQLLSLDAALAEGTDAAAATITQTARLARAGLVIIDGFGGLRTRLAGDLGARGFLYQLGTQVGMLGALLVVVLEGQPPAMDLYPELGTGDIVLGLFVERTRVGHRRYLEVFKRRGAAHLPGLHALTIGPEGLTCYPQFEVTVPPSDEPIDPTARAGFNLPELDAMLHGGVTRRTTTMLAGNLGVGKTTLALQFLADGIARGERGLFLGFRESYPQLVARASGLGVDLADAVERGLVRLILQPPIVLDPDILAHSVQAAVVDGAIRRVVVDSIDELVAAVAPERVYPYLLALVTMLRGRGVTTLLTEETAGIFGSEVKISDVPMSVLADNVLLLKYVESDARLTPVLAVVKMRLSGHDRTIREYELDERGLSILPATGGWPGGPRGFTEPRSGADSRASRSGSDG